MTFPSFIHSFIHSFIREISFIHSFIHSFIPSSRLFPAKIPTLSILSAAFDVYSSYAEVPPHFHKAIHPSMFPPGEEEQKSMHLDRCMRILPHHQNTGGFFVAVFRKVGECPRLHETTILPAETEKKEGSVGDEEKDDVDDKIDDQTKEEKDEEEDGEKTGEDDGEENDDGEEKTVKRPYSPPPNGKIKNAAYAEDPFVFLSWEKDRELLQNLKDFYGFEDDFPMDQVRVWRE